MSAAPGAQPAPEAAGAPAAPLTDPVAEARRLIDDARAQGLTARVLGGVAVIMRSPGERPLLERRLKDVDLAVARGDGKRTAQLLSGHGYVGEEMFNALHGSHRLLFHDLANGRQLDVFIGEFSMCHAIPIAERLDSHPYTIGLAELLLTKLQIVQLNERDERDILTLCYHHDLDGEAERVGALCGADWGLWRTSRGTIERCRADIGAYGLDTDARELIDARLQRLWDEIEAAPKTGKWKRRSRIGERKRWYEEPEEV